MVKTALLITVLPLFAVPVPAQQDEPINLREITDRTVDALDEMTTYRVDEVLKRIRRCIERFNEVSTKMLAAPPGEEDQYIDDLIEFYQYAAEEFTRIDDRKEDISAELSERRSELRGMIGEAGAEARRLRARIVEVDGRSVPTDDFKRGADSLQRSSLKELYRQQIDAVRVWTVKYEEVIQHAGALSTAIDRLLYVIRLSIPIYEQSANTLTMNRDLRNAMALFESQDEIQDLTNEVINSWIQTETLIANALASLGAVEMFPLIP